MGERRPSPRRTWKENHLFVVFGSSSPCNGLRKSAWIFCIIPLTDRRPTIIKYTDAGESNSLWQKQYSNCTLSAWGNSSTFLHPYLLASSLMCLVNIWQQLLACQISLAWRQDGGKQLPWVLPEGVEVLCQSRSDTHWLTHVVSLIKIKSIKNVYFSGNYQADLCHVGQNRARCSPMFLC